jgi:hypothetical protein
MLISPRFEAVMNHQWEIGRESRGNWEKVKGLPVCLLRCESFSCGRGELHPAHGIVEAKRGAE